VHPVKITQNEDLGWRKQVCKEKKKPASIYNREKKQLNTQAQAQTEPKQDKHKKQNTTRKGATTATA
jgi:hypothetical protein